MANSSVKPSLKIPSLLLALFLSFVVSVYSTNTRVVSVSDVCSKHRNPSNCFYILYSIPGSEAGIELGDGNGIPQYLIKLGNTNAFDIMTLLDSLIKNVTDPQLKQRYISCGNDYSDALTHFDSAKDSYTSADYNGTKYNVAIVIKDIQDCDSKPGNDPSELSQINKYMKDVSIIIMILADFLAGKY